MKVAVIGSRSLTINNLGQYLPEETTEIVSGGAKGVDTFAREYALAKGLKLTEYNGTFEKIAERHTMYISIFYHPSIFPPKTYHSRSNR